LAKRGERPVSTLPSVSPQDKSAGVAGLAGIRYLDGMNLPIVYRTVLLLTCSNTFMTFAWYAHLRNWGDKKWYIAAVLSWGIALFEYLLMVPANRIGYTTMSLSQLKVTQEIITMSVFVPFAFFYMRQPLKLDFLWAGLCLVGAAYFMFRG
jgi:uncharacterized protein